MIHQAKIAVVPRKDRRSGTSVYYYKCLYFSGPEKLKLKASAVDMRNDAIGDVVGVAELAQRTTNTLVDDLHTSATDQLLGLDQPEIWLDTGGIAVQSCQT